MGTRCIIRVRETLDNPNDEVVIYRHWDGYPDGVVPDLLKLIEEGYVWMLPRYEPDEFAAGVVAFMKRVEPERQKMGRQFMGGNIRIYTSQSENPSDIEYEYHIGFDKDEGLQLHVYDIYRGGLKLINLWKK